MNRADLEVSTDRADFQAMCRAMSTMELHQVDQNAILAIVASVLHLGNITFTEVDGVAAVEKPGEVSIVAEVRVFEYTGARSAFGPLVRNLSHFI